DVSGVFRELDVYALPSDNEANPNSLLEAMASGLPCVATDVGNVKELLDGGRAGILIQPGDETGLAAAIERLFSQETLRRSLQAEARKRVIAGYSQARMFDAYEALYRSPKTAPL